MRNGSIAAILVVLASVLAATLVTGPDGEVASEIWVVRSAGWVALGALLVSLTVSLVPVRRRRTWRRAWGVAAASVAIGHAGYAIRSALVPDVSLIVYEPMFRAGASTLLVLILLMVTSSTRLVRVLRIRRWANLHALVYVAALTAVHHVALSSHANVRVWLFVAGLVLLLLTARVIRWARAGPS